MLLFSDPHLRCFGENREMIFHALRNPFGGAEIKTADGRYGPECLSGSRAEWEAVWPLRQILAHPLSPRR